MTATATLRLKFSACDTKTAAVPRTARPFRLSMSVAGAAVIARIPEESTYVTRQSRCRVSISTKRGIGYLSLANRTKV